MINVHNNQLIASCIEEIALDVHNLRKGVDVSRVTLLMLLYSHCVNNVTFIKFK